MTIDVDFGRKATKQTKIKTCFYLMLHLALQGYLLRPSLISASVMVFFCSFCLLGATSGASLALSSTFVLATPSEIPSTVLS